MNKELYLKTLMEKKSSHFNSEPITYINVVTKASAGTGVLNLDPESTRTVPVLGLIPNDYDLAIQVSGDSMEPLFQDEEVIFIKKTTEIHSGQIVVVMIDNEIFVKKAYPSKKNLRLVSLNDKYSDIYANEEHDIQIIGRVVL